MNQPTRARSARNDKKDRKDGNTLATPRPPGRRERGRRDDSPRAGRKGADAAEETSGERLHKALAQTGLGSRREMEEWIAAGRVQVNGQPAQIGMSVRPGDRVKVNGRLVYLHFADRLPRVLLYHKPEGEIVSRSDPEGRPSVFNALPRLRGGRWIAVGRLDINTSGLLIFTTSGELANRLMHPASNLLREYAARVLGELSPEAERQLLQGIELEDGMANFASLEDAGGQGANHWYRVNLHEGRNREVRRLFEAVGCKVSRLIRVRYGPFILPPRLKRGHCLELDAAEVARLQKSLGGDPAAESR
ncbi:MAG: pseudouridine synthase [Zoogloeaceae bacterium]|jgi:23S rRNA pseudouridine2605 synthase|nr:pseudouridine synthase [Zoogloeaceae bacterium]